MMSQYIEVLSAGYSYHTRPFHSSARDGLKQYLLRLQSEGACSVLLDGRPTEVESGDLLLFKPTDPYELSIGERSLGAAENEETKVSSGDYFIFCRGEWLDEWWKQIAPPQRIKLSRIEYNQWLPHFRNIVTERRKSDTIGQQIADSLLKVLCLQIERFITLYGASHRDGRAFLAVRMRAYVEDHALTSFTISDVAKHVGLSVSRTVHLYKEMFGKSIMQHAMDIRMESALERMTFTPLTLEQIAETSGFGSYSYFHRCFKDKFGISPREYRNAKLSAIGRAGP
jgi:AraC family transcriptional regulator, arabinose operon regulatory protein